MAKFKPPDVTIYRHTGSKFWYVQYYIHGKRRREPSPYQVRSDAERYAKAMTAKLRRAYYGMEEEIPRAPITLGELAEAYIERALAEGLVTEVTRKSQTQRLNCFVREFGSDRPAASVEEDEVNQWMVAFLKRQATGRKGKISPTTVHNVMVAAKACYRWGIKRKLLHSFPWQYARIPTANTHRDIRIPTDDVQSILDGLDLSRPQHRAILVACYSGLRLTDLQGTNWDDWEWNTGVMRRRTSKTDMAITVVLPEGVRAALVKHRGIGPMFPHVGTWHTWKRITAKLCGREYSFKWFRHTFTTALAEAGVDLGMRKRLMGHSMKETTMGYEHVSVERLREAVSKLPWSHGGHNEAVSV